MARHWEQFAREAGLSAPQVKRRVRSLAKALPALAHQTQARLAQQGHAHRIVAAIVMLIEQRCALALRRLANDGEASSG